MSYFKKILKNITNITMSYTSLGSSFATIGICLLNFNLSLNKHFNINNAIWGKSLFVIFLLLNLILIFMYLIKFIFGKNEFKNTLSSNPENSILVSNLLTQCFILFSTLMIFINSKITYFIDLSFIFLSHVSFLITTFIVLIKNKKWILKSVEFINFWFYGIISLCSHIGSATFVINNNFSKIYNMNYFLSWYLLIVWIIVVVFFGFNFLNIKLLKQVAIKNKFIPKICFIIGSISSIYTSFNSFSLIIPTNILKTIDLFFMPFSWGAYLFCLTFVTLMGAKKYDIFQSSLISYFFINLNATFVTIRILNIEYSYYIFVVSTIFLIFSILISGFIIVGILRKLTLDLTKN